MLGKPNIENKEERKVWKEVGCKHQDAEAGTQNQHKAMSKQNELNKGAEKPALGLMERGKFEIGKVDLQAMDDKKNKVAFNLHAQEPVGPEEPTFDVEEGELSDSKLVEIDFEANQPTSMVVTNFLSNIKKIMDLEHVWEYPQLPLLEQQLQFHTLDLEQTIVLKEAKSNTLNVAAKKGYVSDKI